MGEVIPLGNHAPTPDRLPRPPAPNPDNDLCTTWGEIFDHLMYLADEREHGTLRQLLKDYSIATDGIPLPDGVFDDE